MKKLLFLVIIVWMVNPPAQAAITFNDVVCAFSPSTEKIKLQDNMIAGASSFLAANGKAFLLLSIYERDCNGNLDITAALIHAREALSDLEKARTLYGKALNIGKELGYNEYKRPMFSSYNFSEVTQEKKLNEPIADRVKTFLVGMDVVGLYEQNLQNVDSICITLKDIISLLEAGQTPGKGIMWSLLQEFSEASLFGNYSTIIGGDILMKSDVSSQSGPPICEPD